MVEQGGGGRRGGGGGGGEVQKEEDRLQAIVLADSFTGSFRPCSLEQPKVLLPLLNVPMLDYVMEFLVASGVQEVFIFCVNKKEVVQVYVAQSKWPSSVALRCISSAKCMGAGDALREIDSLGLIRSNPFVVISGDVVSTVNLGAVVAAHKKRRAENSLSILTAVLSKVGYDASVHPRQEDLIVGLNKYSDQLVVYEDNEEEAGVEVCLDLFKEGHPEIDLRNDLMDCHIYVCSPEVLVAFSDNWDYQDMPRYIRNEVQNREMGNRLYAHLTAPSEYAARVHDPHVYHSVSKDLMHRWLYPIVPENNSLQSVAGQQTTFRYQKRFLYKEEEDVNISRSATINKAVLLGQGTSIGPGCIIGPNCGVGRRVKIGANVILKDCHIWNDVVIEDNVVVESSILCDEVIIKAGATIGTGSMLSYGVVIGKGITLPPFSRITASTTTGTSSDFLSASFSSSPPPSTGSSIDSEGEGSDVAIVGEDGIGRIWVPLFDGEKIPEEVLKAQSMGANEDDAKRKTRWEELEEEEEEEDFVLDDDGYGSPSQAFYADGGEVGGLGAAALNAGSTGAGGSGGMSSTIGVPSLSSSSSSATATSDAYFAHVVRDMIISGFASHHAVANILLEIKSFKFAHNRTFVAVIQAVIPALIDLALDPGIVNRQRDGSPPRTGSHKAGAKGSNGGGSGGGLEEARDAAVAIPQLSAKEALFNIEAQIEYWESLLRALNQEQEVEPVLLQAIQAYGLKEESATSATLYSIFGLVLVAFVNADILHNEAAIAWADGMEAEVVKNGAGSDEKKKKALSLFKETRTQKFVTWVRDRESDDDEESSSEEEEEESSSEEEEED